MKIIVIGGQGTIGKKLVSTFGQRGHEVIVAGRTIGSAINSATMGSTSGASGGEASGSISGASGGTIISIQVDISSPASIEAMYEATGMVDAVICTAGTGYYGPFDTMTGEMMIPGIQGKLLGQINIVLLGKQHLNPGGSFTLTTGIAAENPARNGTCVAMINGAVNSFVLGAAQELKQEKRINAVSPGLVEDSKQRYGAFFPGYDLVPMEKLANAYILSVEGAVNGKILKVYS